MLRVVPSVLLVDDDAVILRVLEINFRARGFDVRTASSRSAVLERLREGRPDAIVLDLGLPDDDGGGVLDDLRSQQLGADVPVVIVSGRAPDAAADDGYASRVEAVLLKPVDPADVVETVRGVLRRAG